MANGWVKLWGSRWNVPKKLRVIACVGLPGADEQASVLFCCVHRGWGVGVPVVQEDRCELCSPIIGGEVSSTCDVSCEDSADVLGFGRGRWQGRGKHFEWNSCLVVGNCDRRGWGRQELEVVTWFGD